MNIDIILTADGEALIVHASNCDHINKKANVVLSADGNPFLLVHDAMDMTGATDVYHATCAL